jgi:gamma-glutamyltranspeptidase/glutathione hydrolase
VLRAGGHAVDAAAAVQFALNVVEPQSSGIGGGAFLLLYHAATGETLAFDGREAAPAASTADQFLGPDGQPLPFAEAHLQGTAVGVPGTLRLLATALDRFGTQSLADTLAPAIALAEDGFPINRFLAADLATHQAKLAAWPPSAAIFLPDGQPLREGDLLRQPDLARAFRLIAAQGPAVFYEGEIAAVIVDTQAARGGRMTLADLAAYTIRERDPVAGRYRDYEIRAMPPPSSGGLTLQHLLQLLEPLDLRARGLHSAPTLHLMLEAMRLAYADRAAYLADSDFVPVPGQGLLDPAYVASRRALIDPARATPNVAAGDPFAYEPGTPPGAQSLPVRAESPQTTHFVVVDGQGNVVSVTSSIEFIWGNGMVVPRYGFFLNNELTDFSFLPEGPNAVEPGKRPRSSMTPTIVLRDGQPVLALGSPGGSTIITTVLQVLLNVVEHDLPLQAAVDAPRIYSAAYPDVTWEAALPADTLAALAALGHAPAPQPAVLGSVQAAQRTPGGAWIGAADPRREGTVVYVPPAAPPPTSAP